MTLKGILTVVRIPFLILALILGILGAAVAWYESVRYGSPFNLCYAVLATIGLLIAHAAVNIFNDYFDARSGLDYKTNRTPFSGGSGADIGSHTKTSSATSTNSAILDRRKRRSQAKDKSTSIPNKQTLITAL